MSAFRQRLIVRRDSRDEETFAVIEWNGVHPSELLAALRRALAEWQQTPEGREAWEASCHDFNVGDLANEPYEFEPLAEVLSRHGVHGLQIDVLQLRRPHALELRHPLDGRPRARIRKHLIQAHVLRPTAKEEDSMTTFVVYKQLTEQEIRQDAKKVIEDLERWFQENPRRMICHAELWYGRPARIRRQHVPEDVETAVREALGPRDEPHGGETSTQVEGRPRAGGGTR